MVSSKQLGSSLDTAIPKRRSNFPKVARPDCPRPIDVLGTKLTPFESFDDACQFVSDCIDAEAKIFCVAINPEKVQKSRSDRRIANLINSADMQICDGVGTAVAARWLYGRKLPRITGVDLFQKLIRRAESEGWGIYLLGATFEVNRLARIKLQECFPGLRIVGSKDGYFDDSNAVIRDINRSGADLLFVAMGSPHQEEWISQHRDQIDAPFAMGIGGTLDVVSGQVKRAPKVARHLGLEWFYRLVTQPSRWRRMLVLPGFASRVFHQWIIGRKHKESSFRPSKPR